MTSVEHCTYKGEGPDYPNKWNRSTAWATIQYMKIIEPQQNEVMDKVGTAMEMISRDLHKGMGVRGGDDGRARAAAMAMYDCDGVFARSLRGIIAKIRRS